MKINWLALEGYQADVYVLALLWLKTCLKVLSSEMDPAEIRLIR